MRRPPYGASFAPARSREALQRCARLARAGGASAFYDKGVPVGIMSIVWMIIVGFIVGVLARFVYPGAIAMGFWATAIVGIVGSVVGGVIGGLIWRSADGKFHPAGWILSIVGALIVLWIYLNYIAK